MDESVSVNLEANALTVRQANSLIEASYKMSWVGEARLIRMLIAQIKPTDEDFKTYRIAVADFAKFFGLNSKSIYELIDKAAESLVNRPITIREGKSWLHMSWLSSAKYVQGSGMVELCFDKNLKPYLLQLKGYYSGYNLCNTVHFNSSYSIRIFEILKSNEFKANARGYFQRSFEYQELREMLGIEKNEYKLFADFRINVISMAVKEINANPDLSILKVDFQKTGRKVSHIVFYCERANQIQIPFESDKPRIWKQKTEHPEYIAELIAIGIDEQIAYRWKRKYTVARLRDAIAYTKAMQNSKKIRETVTWFLVHALNNNIWTLWVEENKKKVQARTEHEQAEEAQQDESERKRLESQQKTKSLMDAFHALPDSEQAMIRWLFEAQMSHFLLGHWQKEKENNPRPETHAKFSAAFSIFFEAHLKTTQLPL